jgi:Secretion system C-terminal sorting domain
VFNTQNAAVALTTNLPFFASASRVANDDPGACDYDGIDRVGTTSSRPQLLLEFACLSPVDLQLDGRTSVSGQIRVSPPFDGNVIQKFAWEIGDIGFVPGTMAEIKKGISSDTIFWINGLQPLTTYDVYVRTVCSAGEFSDWFGPLTFTTLPGCGDNYYDSGGENDTYKNDESYEEVLCSGQSDEIVTLTFSLIDLKIGDTLRVFNGSSSLSPLMAELSGFSNQAQKFSSTTISGCITVQFISNDDEVSDGWVASITCAQPDSCFSTLFPQVSNIRPDRATFRWEPMFDILKYDWRIGESPYGPSKPPLKEGSVVSGASVTVTGLFETTYYEFYVRSICTLGDTSAWMRVPFFTPPNCNAGQIVCGATYTFPKVAGAGVYNEVVCAYASAGKERIVRYTAPNTRTYKFEVTTTSNNAIPVGYYIKSTEVGCGPNNWQCLGVFSNPGELDMGPLVAGREYYIRFDPTLASTDSVQQTIRITGCIPTNDEAVSAIPIAVGEECNNNIYGVNLGSVSSGEPDPDEENITDPIAGRWEDPILRTVWFSFVAPISGTVTISTNRVFNFTNLNTQVAVYEVKNPASYGSFRYIESDDNSNFNDGALLIYSGLAPGQTYYVQVDGKGSQINDAFCIAIKEEAARSTQENCTSGYFRTGVNGTVPGGNDWFQFYTNPNPNSAGELVATMKPGSQNLDTVWAKFATTAGIVSHNGLAFLPAFYEFKAKNASTTASTIRLFFTTEEFEALKIAANRPTATIDDLKGMFYTGTGLNCIVTDNNEPPGDTVFVQINNAEEIGTFGTFYVELNIPSMGEIGVFLPIAPVLPLDLISFEGRTMDALNRLSWKTLQENVQWHQVERSTDNLNWSAIGQLEAIGSNTTHAYQFDDKSPLTRAFYRLRSIDYDGTSSLSDIIFLARKNDGLGIVRVFPSPTKSEVNVQYVVENEGDIVLSIADFTGKILWTNHFAATNGLNSTTLPMANLPSGVYLINLICSEGNTAPQKVIKE